MTGNDIISRPLIYTQTRSWRFAKRILNEIELDQISSEDKFNLKVYLHWACKEAAYKIDRKKGMSRKINPKQYVVDINNKRLTVESREQLCRYLGRYIITPKYVHATLWEEGDKVENDVIHSRCSNRFDQSQMLYHHISHKLTHGQCAVKKDAQNIPSLPAWDISISHCGQWGAWSAVKI